jgi:hypothetical protein
VLFFSTSTVLVLFVIHCRSVLYVRVLLMKGLPVRRL